MNGFFGGFLAMLGYFALCGLMFWIYGVLHEPLKNVRSAKGKALYTALMALCVIGGLFFFYKGGMAAIQFHRL